MTAEHERRVLLPREIKPLRPHGSQIVDWSGKTMGTTWSVRAVTPTDFDSTGGEGALNAALDAMIAQMSTWAPHSEISRFNSASEGASVTIGEHFSAVLNCALTVAEETSGAFDPSVGALVDLWGFGAGGERDAPDNDEIAGARAQMGWTRLAPSSAVLCQPGGLRIDLSGIAKGYAVDELARVLERLGLNAFLVEVGGELRGAGVKPDAHPWWVDIEEPPGSRAAPILAALHNVSIASSGDYRRARSLDDRAIAHTIDPRIGHPLANNVASVTVLHAECILADAYATALMVMGPRDGLDHANAHDLTARFVVREGDAHRELLSDAFAALLE